MSAQRIAALAQTLESNGIDCFLAHDPVTMGYLHGFHEGAGERFLTLAINKSGEVRMICPALSASQAKRAGIQNVTSWKDGEDGGALFERLAKEWNLETGILAVDATMPARLLLQLQGILPAALFRNGEAYTSELMRRKAPDEIESMRIAGRIADEAYAEVAPQIKAGITERALAKLLSDAMAARGGQPDFAIVATGKGAAEPHHISDDTPLKRGDVVIMDFGCSYDGYKSDITRTAAIEEASDKARQVYEIVYKAHMAGRAKIKPGIAAEEVDRAARKVIDDAGYGQYFFHRLGHGIGIQIHEAPNIVAGNTDPLEPGNCFSIEPGIYIEGELGVRIENIVACTEDGHESMNVDPSPTLEILG
ncbi:MAG: M24 family metallopeptidase [Fimbriimonas sp.]